MPRAILRVVCAAVSNTGLFSDGLTETKRGTVYPEEMTKCPTYCGLRNRRSRSFLSGSLAVVLSVYLSFCVLWFLQLNSGWMSSRWMSSVGDLGM
jgi:hypothetical protein